MTETRTDTRADTAAETATAHSDAPATSDEGADPDRDPDVERGELIGPTDDASTDGEEARGSITEPAKVMRIGSMVKQLLEEVRAAPLDEASRERLAEIYDRSIIELSEALSPDLQEELKMLALPFDTDAVPSESELRIAKAQLVGWLEGLFHGIQASLVAQQMAARHQLDQMRQLNVGQPDGQPGQPGRGQFPVQSERPGTYL